MSWFQADPEPSLEMVLACTKKPGARVLDVGGGASALAARLVAAGHRPTVLDISPEALDMARKRMGDQAVDVSWIVADVTDFRPRKRWNVWHDRAVFHFLTEAEDRRAYLASLEAALEPDGYAVLGTFAPDGPTRCSGLDVARWDPDELSELFGPGYRLEEDRRVEHATPGGSVQRFTFVRMRRLHGAEAAPADP